MKISAKQSEASIDLPRTAPAEGERNFPSTVKILPTLVINNNNQYCQEYTGLNEIIKYLETATHKLNLLNEALKFAKK